MVKTKQTACGGNTRQVGMQATRFGEAPEEGQSTGVPDDEDKENWPDLDAPRNGEETGETSKSTDKEGDQPAPPRLKYKLKEELQ